MQEKTGQIAVSAMFASAVMGSPRVDAFTQSPMSDSERMLRAADDLDGEAEMLAGDRAGARLMRSAARELRRYARKR